MDDARIQALLTIHVGSGAGNACWNAVEQSLGLKLPGSYKSVVDLFAASRWRDFLSVLSPFDDRLNLERRGRQILDADRTIRAQFPSQYPLTLYPEPGGILPWAITDNGDTLYFITSASPDDWPTMIRSARSPEFEVSFLPPALLIHHIAAGTFRSAILPQFQRPPEQRYRDPSANPEVGS